MAFTPQPRIVRPGIFCWVMIDVEFASGPYLPKAGRWPGRLGDPPGWAGKNDNLLSPVAGDIGYIEAVGGLLKVLDELAGHRVKYANMA